MRETTEAVGGERRGPMLVFKDAEGLRHAVRVTAVIAASDLDESHDATLLQLPNSQYVVVREGLDEVLGWFHGWPSTPGAGIHADAEVARLRQRAANARSVLKGLMACLSDAGLLPVDAFTAIRDGCVASASRFAAGGGHLHQAVGTRGVEDIIDLFSWLEAADEPRGH